MGPKNSACKSGLAVKSGVVKSGKINIIKACKILGPRHHWEKNRKTFFDFLSPRLGFNVSLFRLRQFGKVESELGSPGAGVEIGTG